MHCTAKNGRSHELRLVARDRLSYAACRPDKVDVFEARLRDAQEEIARLRDDITERCVLAVCKCDAELTPSLNATSSHPCSLEKTIAE